ncbi:MAG: HAMP domain-containing histidine kinase [Lachnospiraceae bacterium]|nr:HAMP domain-containing histidine kinase [Lachnospiraceae bacterium]
MNRRKYRPLLAVLLVCVNVAAIAVIAAGFLSVRSAGYGADTWKEILEGKSYVESSEFQEEAAGVVYDALAVVARSSRMETDGEYNPDRIIRIRDYVESGTIYDEMPESEKENGICYRLGDLYQWSLKGTSFSNSVLLESYKPLFYGSIQEYANECDEEYHVVVNEIEEAMELLRREVALYQEDQKNWSESVTNIRYALLDLGNGNVYTNVGSLQTEDADEETLEAYFKALGSYYIYDSRTVGVEQQNVGDYFSYNTDALLTEQNVHLSGEYQVYVGIDTGFPVVDSFSAEAEAYGAAYANLKPYLVPMAVSAVVILLTLLGLLWLLAGALIRLAKLILRHLSIVLRICIYFGAYLLVQALIRALPGDGVSNVLLLLFNLAVLALLVWEGVQRRQLLVSVRAMAESAGETSIPEAHLFLDNREMAEAVNNLGDGLRDALKEQVKSECMKADLITNVSHDLKTPLTSIINYVDLMKREELDNPKAVEYLEVLDQKSQRLKQLTEDLVEASRASSGNIVLDLERIDLKELLMQTGGEFSGRFEARGLKLVEHYPDTPLCVEADGRRLWRIIENLYRNVEKYAMPNTRVYVDLGSDGERVWFSMKNISENSLNISAEELTERFTRGDESRSTEGSGLGLSIARDLTELQKGTFEIYLDGDLFKVTVSFPVYPAEG